MISMCIHTNDTKMIGNVTSYDQRVKMEWILDQGWNQEGSTGSKSPPSKKKMLYVISNCISLP